MSMLLPFLVCFLMSIFSSVIWWRTLSSPYAYGTLSFLICLGVHRLLQFFAELFKMFGLAGYFLEYKERGNATEEILKALSTEALVLSVLLVAFGTPLLLLLKNLLLKSKELL